MSDDSATKNENETRSRQTRVLRKYQKKGSSTTTRQIKLHQVGTTKAEVGAGTTAAGVKAKVWVAAGEGDNEQCKEHTPRLDDASFLIHWSITNFL